MAVDNVLEKPQIIGHVEKSLNYTLYDAKWIPSSARFVVLGSYPRNTGALQVYEIDQGDVKLIKETEKGAALKCSTFGASSLANRHLATGDFNGNLHIWDLEKIHVPVFTAKAHSEIINAIDAVGGLGIGEGAPEIVTGSRDGIVKIWDPRQSTPVASIEPAEGEEKRDCWTVAFGNSFTQDDRVVAAGYDNGDLKLFDLRAMALQWETNLKNGICSLQFDRKDIEMNKMAATTLESKFHVFDMRTQHPQEGFAYRTEKAHKSTIWLARHLPQNRDVFMTLGGNGSLNLWNYEYPEKRTKKEGEQLKGVAGKVHLLNNVTLSTQPICGFDWHPDKMGLAVCTAFDQALRVVIVTKLNRL